MFIVFLILFYAHICILLIPGINIICSYYHFTNTYNHNIISYILQIYRYLTVIYNIVLVRHVFYVKSQNTELSQKDVHVTKTRQKRNKMSYFI